MMRQFGAPAAGKAPRRSSVRQPPPPGTQTQQRRRGRSAGCSPPVGLTRAKVIKGGFDRFDVVAAQSSYPAENPRCCPSLLVQLRSRCFVPLLSKWLFNIHCFITFCSYHFMLCYIVSLLLSRLQEKKLKAHVPNILSLVSIEYLTICSMCLDQVQNTCRN